MYIRIRLHVRVSRSAPITAAELDECVPHTPNPPPSEVQRYHADNGYMKGEVSNGRRIGNFRNQGGNAYLDKNSQLLTMSFCTANKA